MTNKAFKVFYWTYLLAGLTLAVIYVVGVLIGAQPFRYMPVFGPLWMCGLACYQLRWGLRARRATA